MSGGDQIIYGTDDLHQAVGGWRADAVDFTEGEPPDVDGNDWPTHKSERRWRETVSGTNQRFSEGLNNFSDHTENAANSATATDENNAGLLKGVGGNGKLAQGVDLAGMGAMINPFMNVAGQALQAVMNPAGQMLSGGANLIQGLVPKSGITASTTHPIEPVAATTGSGGGGALLETHPVSAQTPLAPYGAASEGGRPTSGASGDRVNPQDKQEDRVQPAGMFMPGSGMAGMGRSTEGGKAQPIPKYKVVTETDV